MITSLPRLLPMASHGCFYHSLTTCLGELDNEDIQVTITDEATGEVLVDEATTTFDNGFIGFPMMPPA